MVVLPLGLFLSSLLGGNFAVDGGFFGELGIHEGVPGVGRFAWITDFHLDPYYGTEHQSCKFREAYVNGTQGCDSPPALIKSAASAVAALNPDFVVFTGDFVRHKTSKLPNPWDNVTAIVKEAVGILTRIPGGHVLGPLGNDDTPRDYWLPIPLDQEASPWLVQMAGALDEGDPVREQYGQSGFFEMSLGGITFISLNTLIYSVHHIPNVPNVTNEDPFGQLAWLRERLEDAAATNRMVWIIGHIPPGIETYAHTPLWHDSYVTAYLNIVEDERLSLCIAAQLFAHVHVNEFRVLTNAPANTGPMLTAGSITPVFKTNPSFWIVEYSTETGRMLNYSVYYTELANKSSQPLDWKFGFASPVYKPFQPNAEHKGITNGDIKDIVEEMIAGGDMWNTYATWYKMNYENDLQLCGEHPLRTDERISPDVKRNCRLRYSCAIHVSTSGDYNKCSNSSRKTLFNFTEDEGHEIFYDKNRAAHWESLGVDTLWEGGGFS